MNRNRGAMTGVAAAATIGDMFHSTEESAMKTWIRRSLLAAFAVTLTLGGVAACGHRGGPMWSDLTMEERAAARGKVVDRIASRLELDAAQKARLQVLAGKLEEQRAALVGHASYPREQVRGLIAGEKFDRARAQALVNEKTAVVQSRSPEVIAALADFYDSLAPAQQAKVRELLQQRRHRWWRS